MSGITADNVKSKYLQAWGPVADLNRDLAAVELALDVLSLRKGVEHPQLRQLITRASASLLECGRVVEDALASVEA